MKNLYSKIEEYLPVAIFLIIFILMVIQVFTRYLFNFSLYWDVELCRYLLVWLTFVGTAYVMKKNSHIKIDLLFNYFYNKMNFSQKKAMWLFKEILTISYFIALIVFGYILAYKSRRFLSQAMQLSQFFLYISVSVGMVFFLVREIQYVVTNYKKLFLSEMTEKSKE